MSFEQTNITAFYGLYWMKSTEKSIDQAYLKSKRISSILKKCLKFYKRWFSKIIKEYTIKCMANKVPRPFKLTGDKREHLMTSGAQMIKNLKTKRNKSYRNGPLLCIKEKIVPLELPSWESVTWCIPLTPSIKTNLESGFAIFSKLRNKLSVWKNFKRHTKESK